MKCVLLLKVSNNKEDYQAEICQLITRKHIGRGLPWPVSGSESLVEEREEDILAKSWVNSGKEKSVSVVNLECPLAL